MKEYKSHEGGVMKYSKMLLLVGLILLAYFTGCDWNNHTEPAITVNNAENLGRAIYFNQTALKPRGLQTVFLNEGDTLKLTLSTDLLLTPNYAITVEDEGVVKIVKDETTANTFLAIAVADSGAATVLNLVDTGNRAEKSIPLQIMRRWADPDIFTYIGDLNNHSYYISNQVLGWVQAEETCRAAGGYMVAINSAEENDFLDIGRIPIEAVWIGVRFVKDANDKWVVTNWVNGDSVTGDAYRNFIGSTTDPGIFSEFYFYMDVNGRWESWHEITYNFFLEME